jgi:hypothetical protein
MPGLEANTSRSKNSSSRLVRDHVLAARDLRATAPRSGGLAAHPRLERCLLGAMDPKPNKPGRAS